MDEGGLLSFSTDGTKVAYNRIFRNFRQWKRYTGGLAQDITIYDIKNNVVDKSFRTRITPTPFRCGMGTRFISLPIAAPNTGSISTATTREQTGRATYQVRRIRRHVAEPWSDAIIFENGGYLYTFDLQARQPKKLRNRLANHSNPSKNRQEPKKSATSSKTRWQAGK